MAAGVVPCLLGSFGVVTLGDLHPSNSAAKLPTTRKIAHWDRRAEPAGDARILSSSLTGGRPAASREMLLGAT